MAFHDVIAGAALTIETIVDQLPAAVAILDGPGLRVHATSAAFRRLVGGRDVQGKAVRDALPEFTGAADLPALLEQVYRSGQPASGTDSAARWDADGDGIPEDHFIDFELSPLCDAHGAVVGVTAWVADVTVRARARMDLEASAARFRNMADSAPVMLWVTEHDGYCTFLNRAWYAFTGQTPETGLGRGWVEAVHPDDRPRTGDAFNAALAMRGSFRVDYRLRTAAGDYRWVLAAASPRLTPSGEFLGYIGSVVDIHERTLLQQELEHAVAELQAVLDVVPVGIGIANDPECRDIRVNPAFADQLGVDTGSNASKTGLDAARLPFHVVDPDGHEIHPEELPMQRAARENRSVDPIELDVVHPDGRRVRLLEYAAPLRDANGAVRGAVGAFVDISERAALLEAERTARSAAEAANAAKAQFLGTMSHELRQPLNAIVGYVDLLALGLRGEVTAAQAADLARVKQSAQHLIGIITDILQYAKLEAGQLTMKQEVVPVLPIVTEVAALLRHQLAERGVRCAIIDHDPTLAVVADRDRVRQILLNLLTNAAKFTPDGGRIEIIEERIRERIAIAIADTGPGIPTDKLHSIFEPFVQAHRSLNRPAEGVGLGLAISSDLAHAMGGWIEVESKMGEGSRFTLVLPAA